MFDAAYGPSRFFFGELFASDRTGASANLGVHAANDTQAAAIGRWLVARDGFDFLLYYLPDVDMAQHKLGPDGALDAVAVADRSIASLIDAGGGLDRFLATTASCCSPTTARPRRARPATCARRWPACACSSARCARRPATRRSRSRRRTASACSTGWPTRRASRDLAARVGALAGVDLAAFHEDGDSSCSATAPSCGSAAAGRCATGAATPGR